MNFVFTGFQQTDNMRRFCFEAVLADRSRRAYVVTADIGLLRKHMIGLQDAPLICLHLLEDNGETTVPNHQMFTEEQMRRYAADRSAKKEASAAKARRPGPRARAAQSKGTSQWATP